jgi:hypothetical protein
MDRELGAVERNFFWLPLGHSEDLALHERGVRHAEEEAANAPPHRRAMAEFGVSQAKAARHVIARFGRHPHRNEILGRTSTPEELEYLRTETPAAPASASFLLRCSSPECVKGCPWNFAENVCDERFLGLRGLTYGGCAPLVVPPRDAGLVPAAHGW